jgi:hypothetical protein
LKEFDQELHNHVFIPVSQLGEIDSEIENEMLVALKRGISERRNKDMVSFMSF